MNVHVNPKWVMKEVGRRLVNNIKFGATVNRGYDGQYKVEGAKVGYTVNARLPQRFKVNKGTALVPQPVNDQVVPITLTDQANVGLEFSMASLTMEVEQYRERYINPAVDAIVNTVDFDGLTRMYQETYFYYGTPGTIPATNQHYLNAGVKLTNVAVPVDGRMAMLNPQMHATLVGANQTLFNPANTIAKQYRTGMFSGPNLGIDEWYQSQNVATHTVGPLGGTPQVNGAGQTGSVIVTSGWTAAAAKRLSKGDVIQFAGCYAINPQNYQSQTDLMDFTVTSDVYSDGAGAASIPISPPMVVTGNLQNVSASPANLAAVTIFGHASSHANKLTPQGLIYLKDAYALVFADLEMPKNLWVSERISNKALGIAIRFLKDYDIMTDQSPARLDVLYGWKAVRPEMALRSVG
jgi:hypothetical protein